MRLMIAAVAAGGLALAGCQTRDVPTPGRYQGEQVGEREPYPGSGLGGAGTAGGAPAIPGTTGGGQGQGADPGQVQSGGFQRLPGHPVLGRGAVFGPQAGQQELPEGADPGD